MNQWILAAVCLLVGGAGALWLHSYSIHRCYTYEYVNSDFGCGNPQVITKGAYVTLVNDLETYFDTEVANREIGEAAVFFRDLEGGPTFSINANVPFVPASLMKLPLVFGYFRYAEDHPEILKTELVYSPESLKFVTMTKAIEQDNSGLEVGQSYTINELLKSTLTHSDNLAYFLLVEYFNANVPGGGQELLRTFQDLGIVDPRDTAEQIVTVRNYASLFRQLYNVSYLSAEDSEEVLSWLADSSYAKGLKAGLPTGIDVAHKFGERELLDGSKQLHDCGIVYFPENPYQLCVMTRGDDWGELQRVVQTVSKMVYNEVNSRRVVSAGM